MEILARWCSAPFLLTGVRRYARNLRYPGFFLSWYKCRMDEWANAWVMQMEMERELGLDLSGALLLYLVTRAQSNINAQISKSTPSLHVNVQIEGLRHGLTCLVLNFTLRSSHCSDQDLRNIMTSVQPATEGSNDVLGPINLPRITIRFCTQCKWMLRAAYVRRASVSDCLLTQS